VWLACTSGLVGVVADGDWVERHAIELKRSPVLRRGAMQEEGSTTMLAPSSYLVQQPIQR
jgi:hypothetical protein